MRESLMGDEENPATRKFLKFTPFTAESYQQLLLWEALEKRKEQERKERSQEAHLKDGELKFGLDDAEDKVIERNPDLEEGKALKREYGEPPAYYMGLPLEEVDKGVTAKTFIVLSRWLNHVQISRFSASPAFFIFPATSPVRRLAILLCTNQIVDFFILFTILTNCICLAIPEANELSWLEYLFFGIYSAEMIIKMTARGLCLSHYSYMRDPWNWLDMIVIASGIPSIALRTEYWDQVTSSNASATQALRTFRVLRAVKTISIFPGLRTIVNAMLRAVKMLMEVVLLTMFFLLVFALVSVQIYRGTLRQKCVFDPALLTHRRNSWESYDAFFLRMLRDPDNWDSSDNYMLCGNITGSGQCRHNYTCHGNIGENPNFGFMNFDNVYSSMLIMFQLMTIDFWENAYRKVLLTNGYLAVIFFILTVFFGSFYLLNLMLAVVTITYQEEAEKTHREIESEKAAKKQRKQAGGTSYNMSSLVTKQNVWAKLIHDNKFKEKDIENPLQKLVRLRTAINVWKKLGKGVNLDPSHAECFQEYATQDRSALDVLQNVAYHFTKWQSKVISKRRCSTIVPRQNETKKLRFDIDNTSEQQTLYSIESYQTPSATPSISFSPHTSQLKMNPKPRMSSELDAVVKGASTSGSVIWQTKRDSIISQKRYSLKSGKRGQRLSLVGIVGTPQGTSTLIEEEGPKGRKRRMGTGNKDTSQNQNQERLGADLKSDDEEHTHPVSTQSQASLNYNTNADRASPTLIQASEDPQEKENNGGSPVNCQPPVGGNDGGSPVNCQPPVVGNDGGSPVNCQPPVGGNDGGSPNNCQLPVGGKGEKTEDKLKFPVYPSPTSETSVDPPKKVLRSFSQVGRQLLISAVSHMEYGDKVKRASFATKAPEMLSSWRAVADNKAAAKIPKPPKYCPKLINCTRRVGSRVRNMIYGVVSDIFFDLFINFCIILNTTFMSLEYHGMTATMAFVITTSGKVFTLIFDVEAILKVGAYGLKDYFKSTWNRFDFTIAVLSSISIGVEYSTLTITRGVKFLRAFRLLRVLKLAQVWPAMNNLLKIIANALSALGQLTIILGIILYIFAIVGLQLFKDKYNIFQFPNGVPRWNFSDFFHSFMMMFRVLCGEWIEPLWDCMRMREVTDGICMLVFFPTLIFGNFIVLNLFLALLLNAFGENTADSSETREGKRLKEAKERFKAKFAWIAHMCLPSKEVRMIIHRPETETQPDPTVNATTTDNPLSRSHSLPHWPAAAIAAAKDGSDNKEKAGLAPPKKELQATTSTEKSTVSAETGTAIYVAFQNTKVRRGAALTQDVIEMKQVVAPLDDVGAPPCCPKFMLDSMFEKRVEFNNSKWGKMWMRLRSYVLNRVQSDLFEYVILFLIIISSSMLAFEDYNYQHSSETFLRSFIYYCNYVFAVLFTLEMILRWIAFGVTQYFTNVWTIIDFVVVVVSVIAVVSTEEGDDDPVEGVKSTKFSDFSAFRALRAFRPLRVVSRIQGMKIVVNSLMRAIPAILNVFMVSLLFWLIFCVMGVQFFRGKFFKCVVKATSDKVSSVTTRAECERNPDYVWFNSYINFDNVANGFLALFQVATFEGWMEIMIDAVDSTEEDKQPKREASLYTYLYFVVFIICGSFFSLNLVIGVIIDNFNVLKKKYEGSYLDGFLTATQRNYYNTLKKMSTRKPQRIIMPPQSRFQLMIYNLSISDRFELLLMGVVFMNMIVEGVEYSKYKLPCIWYEVLWVLDVGFCAFFIIEAILKIVGLRLYYFTLPWNCFDFIVAVLSFLDVGVHLIHQYKGLKLPHRISDEKYITSIQNFLILSPIFLRLLRIFRISRVLRIIKVAKGLRKVVFSLVISLPAIINIMALLMLCLYIYAIFGMFLFSYVKLTGALTPMMNFRSFKGSALLLLSLSTAAGWNDILDPLLIAPPFCNKTHHRQPDGTYVQVRGGDCGNSYLATPYMVSYIILTYLFIINMYIAVILENYNQAHQQEEVGVTEDDFDMFYSVWQRYDPHATQYIPYTLLSDFVADLDTPLGIPKPNEIALVSINLPILQGDRIHCLDIMLALVRNVLTDIDESDEIFTLKQQINTKFRARFPSRTKMKMISTTIERKKEDVAARTLQRAWAVFKTQQAIQSIMKLTMVETQNTSGRNACSVEELRYNIMLAHAEFFQRLTAVSNRRDAATKLREIKQRMT